VKNAIRLFAFALFVCIPASAQTQSPVRVNCGGPSYTDSRGQIWQADTGFSGGSAGSTSLPISATPDPALFQTFRFNPGSYSFNVINGSYQVNLYFAEDSPRAETIGGRVFNVSAQGTVALSSLDIFAVVGANTALIESIPATVSNGTLTLGFTAVSGMTPKIDAIEILPASQATIGPVLTLNFKYPTGTPVTGVLNYSVTSSLLSFSGSQALVNGVAQCVLFANPSALGISTQFQVSLSLADTSGNTLWQMTLSLNPAQVNFGTVQSSILNVVVQQM
jgi:hypothetical protein